MEYSFFNSQVFLQIVLHMIMVVGTICYSRHNLFWFNLVVNENSVNLICEVFAGAVTNKGLIKMTRLKC